MAMRKYAIKRKVQKQEFRCVRGETGWLAYSYWRDPSWGPHQVRIAMESRKSFRGWVAHTAVEGRTPYEALSRLQKQLGAVAK